MGLFLRRTLLPFVHYAAGTYYFFELPLVVEAEKKG